MSANPSDGSNPDPGAFGSWYGAPGYYTQNRNDPFITSGALDSGFTKSQWDWLSKTYPTSPTTNTNNNYQPITSSVYNPTGTSPQPFAGYQNPFTNMMAGSTSTPTAGSTGTPTNMPANGNSYQDYLNQFTATLPNYQLQNPFGVSVYGFSNPPMSTPAPSPAPVQAPRVDPTRYEQRYANMMSKWSNGAASTPQQQEMLQSLQSGQIPDRLKNSPLYERMVTNRIANDQQRLDAEAAKPWFLQKMETGPLYQLPEEQRKQYLDARNQERENYYRQNPNEIPESMQNMAGPMGKYWSALAGNYTPFEQQATDYSNKQQELYDKYQTILNQQSNIASNPTFEAFKKSWTAIPGAAQGSSAGMTPEQAYAAATTLNIPWNELSNGVNSAALDVFKNGPMDKENALKYFADRSTNMQDMKRGSRTQNNQLPQNIDYSANPYSMNINNMYSVPGALQQGPWSFMNSLGNNPFWSYSGLNPNYIMNAMWNY